MRLTSAGLARKQGKIFADNARRFNGKGGGTASHPRPSSITLVVLVCVVLVSCLFLVPRNPRECGRITEGFGRNAKSNSLFDLH